MLIYEIDQQLFYEVDIPNDLLTKAKTEYGTVGNPLPENMEFQYDKDSIEYLEDTEGIKARNSIKFPYTTQLEEYLTEDKIVEPKLFENLQITLINLAW